MELEILAWEIYYADGSIILSDDSSWEEAPDDNVLAVIYWHKFPYRTYSYGTEPFRLKGSEKMKWGKEIPDDKWEEFRTKIHNLPHKLE